MTVNAGMNTYINIDEPPVYDVFTKNKDYVSDVWRAWFTTFFQTLTNYINQNGIFLPQLTTAQRDALNNPAGGQMIYNIDTGVNAVQVFIITSASPYQGTWKTVTVS